jgi:D-sedoheptulose 7-phosphate isomerase
MDINEFKKCVNQLDENKLELLRKKILMFKDIIILGNGGSNAISSHIAEDYTKMLNKRALSFSDSARMSCYANDYGWEESYYMFLKQFANETTLVILISSSGNSNNILKCASFCSEEKIPMITMSGFSPENKLKSGYEKESQLHFWIDSTDYGIVETLHELILHSVI